MEKLGYLETVRKKKKKKTKLAKLFIYLFVYFPFGIENIFVVTLIGRFSETKLGIKLI